MHGRRLTLSDGRSVRIRPIADDDGDALDIAFDRLSPRSRWLRFGYARAHLPASELRYLTHLDHRSHDAVVAVDELSCSIVGVARYISLPSRQGHAEVAATVLDDWQRRGLGGQLLHELALRARRAGVEQLVAMVAAENPAVIHALRRAGAVARAEIDHVELVIDVGSAVTRTRNRSGLSEAHPQTPPEELSI